MGNDFSVLQLNLFTKSNQFPCIVRCQEIQTQHQLFNGKGLRKTKYLILLSVMDLKK